MDEYESSALLLEVGDLTPRERSALEDFLEWQGDLLSLKPALKEEFDCDRREALEIIQRHQADLRAATNR